MLYPVYDIWPNQFVAICTQTGQAYHSGNACKLAIELNVMGAYALNIHNTQYGEQNMSLIYKGESKNLSFIKFVNYYHIYHNVQDSLTATGKVNRKDKFHDFTDSEKVGCLTCGIKYSQLDIAISHLMDDVDMKKKFNINRIHISETAHIMGD